MTKLDEVKYYIENNYSITVEKTMDCLKKLQLLMKDKKYDITIQIHQPSEDHYLYGKCKYVLDCTYEANKKYKSELCYHSGGYSCEYTNENIDRFLNRWFKKNREKQLTIFDI